MDPSVDGPAAGAGRQRQIEMYLGSIDVLVEQTHMGSLASLG